MGRAGGGEIPRLATGGLSRDIKIHYGKVPASATDIGLIANQAASSASFQTSLKLVRIGKSELGRLLAAARARQAAKAGGGNGGYKGPVGAGAAGIRRIANSFHPSYIAGHRDPQGGPAFDIGSSGQKNTNIGNALRANHGKLGLRYIIRQMQISSARGGWGWRRYTPITGAGDFRHVNHVHVSYRNGGEVKGPRISHGTYDRGGVLQPGLNLAYNGTGRPERVLTSGQERALMQAAAANRSGRGGNNFNAYGADPRAVAREVMDMMLLHDALVA